MPGWHTRALVVFAAYFLLPSYLPLLWADALVPLQLLDVSGWPMGAAMALGLVVYELFAYAYHRGMHSIDAWCRAWRSRCSACRLPPAPATATATMLVITSIGIFQHANLRTPHWLGYFVQRPESHTIHHACRIHAKNYADLPVIDMLFGSFENPRRFQHATGFWDGASARVLDMLLARDVSRPASNRP